MTIQLKCLISVINYNVTLKKRKKTSAIKSICELYQNELKFIKYNILHTPYMNSEKCIMYTVPLILEHFSICLCFQVD